MSAHQEFASRLVFVLTLVSGAATACSAASPPIMNSVAGSATTSSQAVQIQNPALTIISWNMKHLGRANQNTEAAAALLDGADLMTFQEVNSAAHGQEALMRLATQLRKRIPNKFPDRICVGLSARKKSGPTGGKERYGYLWKDSRVAYVKTNGEVMTSCPQGAVTIRVVSRDADQIVREPAFGTFFAKAAKRKFALASVHLVPSGKKPQLEVPYVFDSVHEEKGPIIVAGDYNLDSSQSSFRAARELGFTPAFVGTKTSLKMKKRQLSKAYDNFWFKGFSLKKAQVLNLYVALPQMSQKEIYNSISDHSPIRGEFEFSTEVRKPTSEVN